MISVGVTVVGSFGSVEGTTGSTTVPTKWWTCHLNPRTGSSRPGRPLRACRGPRRVFRHPVRMPRRLASMLLGVAAVIVLAACHVDATVELTIRPDGTGSLTVTAVADADV